MATRKRVILLLIFESTTFRIMSGCALTRVRDFVFRDWEHQADTPKIFESESGIMCRQSTARSR